MSDSRDESIEDIFAPQQDEALVSPEEEAVVEQKEQEEANADDGVGIKASDQAFIQNNYKKLSLEQLSEATQLPPEVIEGYVEAYEAYLIGRGISPDNILTLEIGINLAGDVHYGLKAPRTENITELKKLFGKLLFLLTTGELNQSIANFLRRIANEQHCHILINGVMEQWTELLKSRKKPIVSPHEVFKNE